MLIFKPSFGLTREIKAHKTIYFLLFVILLSAAFLRLYKLDQLLGFWYDQGRDALVVWRLIHEGKFFLIGPVTGIEGIFLGPFYYYLLTPLYFLGGGSPIFVAMVLNLISVFGIFVLYLTTKEFFNRRTALLSSFLVAFSYSLVTFSRWLSHPPLLPTFSLVVVYAMLQIYRGKERWWLVLAVFEGLSLQLEAAAAIFFIPTILIFAFWQRKKLHSIRILLGAIVLFVITLLPQVIFNWRHDGILWQAFQRFLVSERSFYVPFGELVQQRLYIYFDVLFSKFFYADKTLKLIWLGVFVVLLFFQRKEAFRGERRILWLWLVVPLILYLFYQGNYGYFLDYYLSGIWSVFIILVSFFLSSFWPKALGKVVLTLFLISFLYVNVPRLSTYYLTGIGIKIRDQLLILDWLYQDAKNQNFNADVYVPPVIPYAYDYLFKWYGVSKYGREPLGENVSLLYTVYEDDFAHPERLEKWLERQGKIGRVVEVRSTGDITVQRRERYK